jgi:hypothetical protein
MKNLENRPRPRLLPLAMAALASGIAVMPRAQAQLQEQPPPPPYPPPQPQASPQGQGDLPQVWQSPQPRRPGPELEAPRPRGDHWQAAAGGGAMMVRSAGLDPFSTEDAVGRFSLSVSAVVWRQDRLDLAVGLGLDTGSSSATARGASSELSLALFTASAEVRYHLAPRFYAFGRLAPGVQHGSATLKESSAPGDLNLLGSFTTAALATSVGAAVCLNGQFRTPGAWFILDGGYLLAPSRRVLLRPDLGDDVAQVASLDLGTIAPRGIFGRLSFALSF